MCYELSLSDYYLHSVEIFANTFDAVRITHGNNRICYMRWQKIKMINAPVVVQDQVGFGDTGHGERFKPIAFSKTEIISISVEISNGQYVINNGQLATSRSFKFGSCSLPIVRLPI